MTERDLASLGDRCDRIHGCLLGGAIGDSLGSAVEGMSLAQILEKFGPDGVQEFPEVEGRGGATTDETQLTLWTAEGLIRAQNRAFNRGLCSVPDVVWGAYQRWLHTQGEVGVSVITGEPIDPYAKTAGWLLGQYMLHVKRNPGKTTLTALRSKTVGTLEAPPNTSKGSGALARSAPVGLIAREPFDLGCELAVITHGHPTGYLAAGAFALIVGEILDGAPLPAAIHAALVALESRDGHEETSRAITRASQYAFTRPATAETVEALGKGWMAHEALAIALFCALVARDFDAGVSLAVNHGGDSDATGSLTGQLLGVRDGRKAVPERRIQALNERWLIERVAEDLYRHFYDRPPENLPLDAGFDPYGLQEPIEPERYPPN